MLRRLLLLAACLCSLLPPAAAPADTVDSPAPAELPAVDIDPDDDACIFYTSGTTGFPKGAVLHHQGLVQNGYDAMCRAGCEPGDVFVHHMPLFHTTGCAILVCGGLGVGATIMTPNGKEAVSASQIVEVVVGRSNRADVDVVFGEATVNVRVTDRKVSVGAQVFLHVIPAEVQVKVEQRGQQQCHS